MSTINFSPSELFRSTIIIWMAMIAGVFLISTIFIFVIGNSEGSGIIPFKGFALDNMFILFGGLTLFSCLGMSQVLRNRHHQTIGSEQNSLTKKVEHYRSGFIVNAALIEGAILFNLVFMFIENNLAYFVLVAIGIFFFLQIRPSLDEFKQLYNLNSSERQEMGA